MPHFKSQRQKVKFLPSGIGISGISRSNTITVAKYVVLVQGVGCYCCRYSLIYVRKQPCGNYPFSRLVRYFPIWASGFFLRPPPSVFAIRPGLWATETHKPTLLATTERNKWGSQSQLPLVLSPSLPDNRCSTPQQEFKKN